jgi:hypothetical protein
MRLHSTLQSFLKRDVTALAIAESILALGVTVWLAWHGRWVYLGCAALVTPLFMLRTPESTERGVRWFTVGLTWLLKAGAWSIDLLEDNPKRLLRALFLPSVAIVAVAYLLPVTALFSVAVKLASTVTSLLTRPLSCLLAIPHNWFAQMFCIDSFHPPELVPGIESASDEHGDMPRFSSFVESVKDNFATNWERKIRTVALALGFVPAFALTLLYRLSLKGTAIVWLPLLWIVPKLAPKESVMTRLRLLNKSSWGRLTVFLSSFTMAGFVTKIVIYQGKIALSRIPSEGNLGRLVQDYVAPTILPPWQIASVINAVVAIVMFLWAGDQIIRLQDQAYGDQQSSGDAILRSTSVIRAVLSLYTSACLVYLAVVRAHVFELPHLGDKLFPWSH